MRNIVIMVLNLFIQCAPSNVEPGAHNIVLLTEGSSFNLPCMPMTGNPSKDELETYRSFSSQWYNITDVIFDPNRQAETIQGDQMQYNEYIIHATNGQLLLKSITQSLNGYYECAANITVTFGGISNEKSRHIRHLIEVTSAPIWVATIRIEFQTQVETHDLLYRVLMKAQQIASSPLITNEIFIPESMAHCTKSALEEIDCEVTLEIRPQRPDLRSKCSKHCLVRKMLNSLHKDVSSVRKIVKDMEDEEKWLFGDDMIRSNSSTIRVSGYRDCPLGYWQDNHYCRPCHPGKYRDFTSSLCEPCPQNQYQPLFSQRSCIACPEGMETLNNTEGASSINNCRSNTIFGKIREKVKKLFRKIWTIFKE